MKTILLTGATGYLGAYLADYFLSKKYKIIALALNKKETFKFAADPAVKVYFLDSTDPAEIFKENKIDIVIHTATLYGRGKEDVADMVRANVAFPVRILSLACEHGAELFINTDTILTKNLNPYSLTKSHFADWLAMFQEKIKCVNLRLDHFYGPNDNPIKFVAWIMAQFRAQTAEINLTEGSQSRDFVYIDDVVSAYACVVENASKIPGGKVASFEVGTNIKTTIKELVLSVKNLLENTKTKLNFGAVPYRKNEVLDYEVDTAALNALGWRAKVGLQDGLKKILEIEKEK